MNKKETFKISMVFSIIAISLIVFIILFTPESAMAATTIQFSKFINELETIVTSLLLPIAIVLCAWKLIYIAIVGGVMGMDPMNIISDQNNDGQLSFSEIKIALMQHVGGFIKGLCWVGGIFIVFRLVLGLADTLAGAFVQNF